MLAFCSNTNAQSATPYEGGRALAEVLFGRGDDRAYRERLAINAEILAAQEREALLRAEREGEAAIAMLHKALASDWVTLGLEPEEAMTVAKTYQRTDAQPAIDLRVRKAGLNKTVADIIAAYKRYDYLLANQLLVGIRGAKNLPE